MFIKILEPFSFSLPTFGFQFRLLSRRTPRSRYFFIIQSRKDKAICVLCLLVKMIHSDFLAFSPTPFLPVRTTGHWYRISFHGCVQKCFHKKHMNTSEVQIFTLTAPTSLPESWEMCKHVSFQSFTKRMLLE